MIALDLNLVKTIDEESKKEDITKKLMMFIYDNSKRLVTILLKDYIIEDNVYKRCPIGTGVISYSHLMDIFKLTEFKGMLILDENEGIHI